MRSLLFLFILGAAMFSCSSSSNSGYKPPYYEKLADEITAETCRELYKELHLYPVGTGGAMMNDIQMMSVSFNYYHEVTVEEGRRLIIKAVEKFLSNINANEEIRPFLHNIPFAAKNIDVVICFYTPKRGDSPPESIHLISCSRGKVRYKDHDPETDLQREMFSESYEEAVGLVASQG